MLAFAKDRDKTLVLKYISEKKAIESSLDQALRDPNLDNIDKRVMIKEKSKELELLERKYHMTKRENIAMKNRLEGEMMCKF